MKIALLEYWDFQNTDSRRTNQQTSIDTISTSGIFSMPTLKKEFKPVEFVKYEFQHREIVKLKSCLWNVRIIMILMQGRRTMIFQLNTHLKVLFFY